MNNEVSLLMIGDEVLDGRVAETNSQFLIGLLAESGYSTAHVLSCRDDIADICSCLEFLRQHSSVIICSGGLGPTSDDLTRQAAAALAGVPLETEPQALQQVREAYRRRGREPHDLDLRQAVLPRGVVVLPNALGTAPGFALPIGGENVLFVALPGVPSELDRMFREEALPLIRDRLGEGNVQKQQLFRIFGKPEAEVGRIVEALSLPGEVSVSYRAAFPEIQLRLKTKESQELLAGAAARVRTALGEDCIFSEKPEVDLVKTVHGLLLHDGRTLSVAESCSGGLLGSLLTKYSGSSRCFVGGVISYDNSVKTAQLGVSPETLQQAGAVSEECAMQMAEGVRRRMDSDLALSITGIAGPDGGRPEKPVGTFYVGLASASRVNAYRYFLHAERNRVQLYSAWTALDLLRRFLSGLPLKNHAAK